MNGEEARKPLTYGGLIKMAQTHGAQGDWPVRVEVEGAEYDVLESVPEEGAEAVAENARGTLFLTAPGDAPDAEARIAFLFGA